MRKLPSQEMESVQLPFCFHSLKAVKDRNKEDCDDLLLLFLQFKIVISEGVVFVPPAHFSLLRL